MNSTITIRLNEEEKKIFNEYSKLYKGGISTMIKHLALEKIQDEFDLNIAKNFEKGIKNKTITIRPYEELLKELDLD